MKTLIILSLISFSILIQEQSLAQCEFPINENGKYEIKEIVEFDKTYSEREIYGAAMLAFAEVFKSAKDVIEVENEGLGYIAGQFVVHSKPFSAGFWQSFFTFSIRVDIKKGRYRILIKYLNHVALAKTNECSCPNSFLDEKCGSSCLTKNWWKKQKCAAHNDVLGFVDRFKKLVNDNLSGDEEW